MDENRHSSNAFFDSDSGLRNTCYSKWTKYFSDPFQTFVQIRVEGELDNGLRARNIEGGGCFLVRYFEVPDNIVYEHGQSRYWEDQHTLDEGWRYRESETIHLPDVIAVRDGDKTTSRIGIIPEWLGGDNSCTEIQVYAFKLVKVNHKLTS